MTERYAQTSFPYDTLEFTCEQVVITLQSQIGSLRNELERAQSLSETHRAECNTWKTRYEDLKPQLTGSAAINTQLLDSLRELLEEFKARSSMVTEAASPNTAAAPHATVEVGAHVRLPTYSMIQRSAGVPWVSGATPGNYADRSWTDHCPRRVQGDKIPFDVKGESP